MDAKITISFKSIPLYGTYLASQKLSVVSNVVLYSKTQGNRTIIESAPSNENTPRLIIHR